MVRSFVLYWVTKVVDGDAGLITIISFPDLTLLKIIEDVLRLTRRRIYYKP